MTTTGDVTAAAAPGAEAVGRAGPVDRRDLADVAALAARAEQGDRRGRVGPAPTNLVAPTVPAGPGRPTEATGRGVIPVPATAVRRTTAPPVTGPRVTAR